MLEYLYRVEQELFMVLRTMPSKTMYIDYHDPYVKRITYQYSKFPFAQGDIRVFLHKIYPCNKDINALWHPHPWHSAVRILSGAYEMGIGYEEGSEPPKTACKLILGPGSCYEMTEPDAWHYVKPIKEPVYSLMVVGNLNGRKMPPEATPEKKFRELTSAEMADIIKVTAGYYNI